MKFMGVMEAIFLCHALQVPKVINKSVITWATDRKSTAKRHGGSMDLRRMGAFQHVAHATSHDVEINADGREENLR